MSLLEEPKKRLRPARERGMRKKRKLPNQKHAKHKHDVHIGTMVAQVNPKRQKPTCSFCRGEHKITSCERREQLLARSMEYQLTIDNQHTSTLLRDRIKTSMPFIPCDSEPDCLIYGNIGQKCYPLNFVLHSVYRGNDGPSNRDNVYFCVTFLDKFANPVPEYNNVCVSEEVLNALLNTTRKKVKFVFDETVHTKKGWCLRVARHPEVD